MTESKPEPIIRWAVVDNTRHPIHSSICKSKHSAVDRFVFDGRKGPWTYWQSKGYRVAKFELREVEE